MPTETSITDRKDNTSGEITRTTTTVITPSIWESKDETRTVVEKIEPGGSCFGLFDKHTTISDTTTRRK